MVLRYLIFGISLLFSGYAVLHWLFARDYHRNGRLSLFAILLGSLVFFAWGGFPMVYGAKDWPAVQVGFILYVLGSILLWGGLAVLFIGMAQLGVWCAFGQRKNVLIQHGFYRFSRNPQIVGCVLYGVGFAVLWPSWYALGWVLMLAFLTHVMVLTEEVHLRHIFGEAYEDYCRRVARYVGWYRGNKTKNQNLLNNFLITF